MSTPRPRYETVAEVLADLVVHPSDVFTAHHMGDTYYKVRIEFAHAGDKHFGVMVGWIVPAKKPGEYRMLSRPTSKSRKLPAHVWRIDNVRSNGTPLYLCPALRKESPQ